MRSGDGKYLVAGSFEVPVAEGMRSGSRKIALHFHSFSWILTFWEVIFEVPGIVFGGLGGTRDHLGLQGDPGLIFT